MWRWQQRQISCSAGSPGSRNMNREGSEVPRTILALVEDIFFLAKIQQTAKQLGLTVESVTPAALHDRLARGEAGAILLDLNHQSGNAMAVLEALRSDPATRSVPVVAFLSHVQADLAQAARAAGCSRVMARSAFSQQLPALLREFSQQEDPR